jgi:8-oxo-dGTP diphosphatase
MTDWTTWEPNMRATLIFVIQGEQILLIRKKRGLGAGKINGPGGKIDPGETPEVCAVREAEEELHIAINDPSEIGILHFQFTDGLAIQCHVFRATQFTGTPTETDEAIPIWTSLNAIPIEEMWEDDRYWIDHLIHAKTFRGYFEFDGELMLSNRVDLL